MGQYYELSNELIEIKDTAIVKSLKKGKEIIEVIGYNKDKLSISDIDSLGFGTLWLYDENIKRAIKDIDMNQNNKKIIEMRKADSLLILRGYFNLPDNYMDFPIYDIPINDFDYQDFWTQLNGDTYMVARLPYHFVDKSISFRISANKKYLILNPYYAGIDLLADNEDNIVILYKLDNFNEKGIIEQRIPCERCFNTFIINDSLIFGKEFTYYDEYGSEYTYSNIYKAPISDINDTIIIACNIELIEISPDGQYILGKHKLYGKELIVIVDVISKRYQHVTGRQYLYEKSFYSYKEKKFTFDFGNYFISIEFPEKYPNNALEKFNLTTKGENKKFWENHKLENHNILY
jgi:hypothetical protein